MGGLPRWEYILHLFVIGFHFASIAVYLAIKLNVTTGGIEIVSDVPVTKHWHLFNLVARNLLPGAFILAVVHIVTSIAGSRIYWNRLRVKINCC